MCAKMKLVAAAVSLLTAACTGICGTAASSEAAQEKNALDLFSTETIYAGESNVRELGGRFGSQDELSNTFTYGHRFLLKDNWYFRAGTECHRYDFGGAESPLPSHLQSVAGTLAVEYVIQNHSGAAIEIHPGIFTADGIHGSDSFDIPWDIYAGFPIKKDKLYGILGGSGAMFYSVPVVPIFGVVWLATDDFRVEAIFPKSTVVYTVNKDWELNLTWELIGGGFRMGETGDPRLSHSVVEYYDNRAGAQAIYAGWKPFKLTAGAGWVIGRTYDFFRAGQKFSTEGAPFLKLAVEADF